MPETEVSPPLIGFEVQSGQFQSLDDEGVTTAPIVKLVLHTPGDDSAVTIPAEVAPLVAKAIAEGAEHSINYYYNARQIEAQRRKDRRHRRVVLTAVAVFVLAFMALNGVTEAHTYTHQGGVIMGIFGALNMGWQLIGMVVVMGMLGQFIRRHRGHLRPRLPKRRKPSTEGLPSDS